MSQLVRVVAQYARAERMEGHHPHSVLSRNRLNTLFHLPCGFVRKSYCQNAVRRNAAFFDKICNSVRKNTGFSASRARKHQNGAFGIRDGFKLLLVEQRRIIHNFLPFSEFILYYHKTRNFARNVCCK